IKITVIATGFGRQATARPSNVSAQTPVDMTPYSDATRTRIEMPPVAPPANPERLTLRRHAPVRRRIVEMPPLGSDVPSAGQSTILPLQNAGDGDALPDLPDNDTAAFDVPAFLRRQEG